MKILTRDKSLDYIRVLGLICVFFFHFLIHVTEFKISEYNYSFSIEKINLGFIGVSIFVILAGSSLYLSSYKKKIIIYDFYKKRLKSLMIPFYYSYVIIMLVILLIHHRLPYLKGIKLDEIILTFLGLDGFFYQISPNFYLIGEWFLGFILIIYFMAPFLYLFLKKHDFISMIISIVVVVLVIKYYNNISNINIVQFPLVRILEFNYGMYFIKNIIEKRYKKIILFNLLLFFVAYIYNNNYFIQIILMIFSFSLLYFLAKIIKINIIYNLILKISNRSYLCFLIHHQILVNIIFYLNKKGIFFNKLLSIILFFIIFIIVYTAAIGIEKIILKTKTIRESVVKWKFYLVG